MGKDREDSKNRKDSENRKKDNIDKGYSAYSGLLSWKEIMDYGLICNSDGIVITEKDSNGKKPSGSYDMHVGDRHFLYESSGHWKPVYLGEPSCLRHENENVDEPFRLKPSGTGDDFLTIPPFGSAIIQLNEIVDLYTVAKNKRLMIAGRFDLKLKAIYKGLISQQATQVEPCYRGRLYCFVHNLGEQAVILQKGVSFATIEFSYVGQGLNLKDRESIIDATIASNNNKYKESTFAHKLDNDDVYTGIEDVRWLENIGLPEQCGIAPIHNLVKGNIDDQVDKHLEKSSTIELITNRVSNLIKEKENLLRIVLSIFLAIISFLATNVAMEARAELRYFSEELSFFSDNYASVITFVENEELLANNRGYNAGASNSITVLSEASEYSTTSDADVSGTFENVDVLDNTNNSNDTHVISALESFKEHTQALKKDRDRFFYCTIIIFVIVFVLAIILLFKSFDRNSKSLEANGEVEKTPLRLLCDNDKAE